MNEESTFLAPTRKSINFTSKFALPEVGDDAVESIVHENVHSLNIRKLSAQSLSREVVSGYLQIPM
jgi:hypothetical protein